MKSKNEAMKEAVEKAGQVNGSVDEIVGNNCFWVFSNGENYYFFFTTTK